MDVIEQRRGAAQTLDADGGAAVCLDRIRVETALSRFPIHRLAKKNVVAIDLEDSAENGEPSFKWEVTFNQKHGQPGPLAYKLDTLIVNRRIDAAGRPLPQVIKLGSLTELCAALGISDSGENRSNLRKALHQNASAYITAKIRYRTKTGKDRWVEINYSRYSVIFTGEVLPDGRVADGVFIIPNTSYRDLLNNVETRPLDYDYLMLLPPGPQRFYELLSFQVYGAIAGQRPRAKMVYSEYCKYAPQCRYLDFDRVKKQMYKLHVPHRESGYIIKVDYQQTVDAAGAPDWEMLYTPGPKAVREFEVFTRRQVRRIDLVGFEKERGTPEPIELEGAPEASLMTELARRGVAQTRAAELLKNIRPEQEVLDQLEYVDHLVAKDAKGRLTNPPGLYITYVRDNIAPPSDFISTRKRQLADQLRRDKKAEETRAAQAKLEYEKLCDEATTRYIAEKLTKEEYEAMLEKHRKQNRQLFLDHTNEELDELSAITLWGEIRLSNRIQAESPSELKTPT